MKRNARLSGVMLPRNPAAEPSADSYRMASNAARIKPDGPGRRRFRSTLDILVRDSSACHERRGQATTDKDVHRTVAFLHSTNATPSGYGISGRRSA
ncbi:MAG: hypothetical protein WCO86_11430, partial [Planctomycetota bacterium]